MAPPWPSGAQPVNQWGLIAPDSATADLVEVPNGKKLAVSSILFSFSQDPRRAADLTLNWETVTYDSYSSHHVIASWHFYQLRLPVGPNLLLTFPTPLVLTGPDHGTWWFRMTPANPRPEPLDSPKVNVLTVGYIY